MQSQTRLTWIGLIIAVGFGLAIETLKSTRSSESSWHSNLFGLAATDDSSATAVSPHRDQATRARSRLLRGRLAGLDGTPANLAPAAVEAVVTSAAGAPNLGTPNTINIDEAKKKADEIAKKKKKKKKKKSKAPDTTENIDQTPTTENAAPTPKSNAVSSGGMYGGTSGTTHLTFAAPNSISENPETLEEWLAYILREPSYEHTMKLIKAQQEHSIDSNIFHEVISQMLADSRDKMQAYAILALGASPSLKSFLLLNVANGSQSEGSPLRLQSRAYLKAYSKLENLRYLASAISSEAESAATLEAMHLIQVAVANYKPKPTTPSTGGPATAATPAAVTRQFTPLLSVLSRVIKNATDAALRQEADRTLEQVQTLVGTTTAAAA